jgi:hypothetical protein
MGQFHVVPRHGNPFSYCVKIFTKLFTTRDLIEFYGYDDCCLTTELLSFEQKREFNKIIYVYSVLIHPSIASFVSRIFVHDDLFSHSSQQTVGTSTNEHSHSAQHHAHCWVHNASYPASKPYTVSTIVTTMHVALSQPTQVSTTPCRATQCSPTQKSHVFSLSSHTNSICGTNWLSVLFPPESIDSQHWPQSYHHPCLSP